MLSVTIDSSGSPKKRSFSRGISEDESLRSIIKETESSSRRLTRSDSRAGTLKRRSGSQQSEQDLFMGLPDMLELQASYDEAVQELRGLEVEREALLFQVDVLQDTLEGVEELLAEAQREAGQANLELEREREAKRKLESMVCSLMKEVERLKEGSNGISSVSVDKLSGEHTGHQMRNDTKEVSQVAHTNKTDSSSSGSRKTEGGQDEEAEDEGNILMKLRRMVNMSPVHTPSLALGNPVSTDGVLQRPYENSIDEGRDPSPDRNDSDSLSAYEDASAETPEQDRMFPDDADTELPHDSVNKDGTSNDSEHQDAKNPEACIVS